MSFQRIGKKLYSVVSHIWNLDFYLRKNFCGDCQNPFSEFFTAIFAKYSLRVVFGAAGGAEFVGYRRVGRRFDLCGKRVEILRGFGRLYGLGLGGLIRLIRLRRRRYGLKYGVVGSLSRYGNGRRRRLGVLRCLIVGILRSLIGLSVIRLLHRLFGHRSQMIYPCKISEKSYRAQFQQGEDHVKYGAAHDLEIKAVSSYFNDMHNAVYKADQAEQRIGGHGDGKWEHFLP